MSDEGSRGWRGAMLHAAPLVALALGLIYRWFAAADRHIVFLYYHDMGPRVPDTAPFSAETASRYWMAGLVASGAALVLHTGASWLAGRMRASYRPPSAWRAWALCAGPLAVGIPLITMTANQPTLPAANAAGVTAATLAGLALALAPGSLAAERPRELLWLASDGMGMALVLVMLGGVESALWGLNQGAAWYLAALALGLAAGVGWLLAMTGAYALGGRRPPGAWKLLAAGATVGYLALPLAHHVLGTDGYFYISSSSNFFASNPAVQAAGWAAAGALALGVARLRRRLRRGDLG